MLILNEPNRIFNASTCGDNCSKWLLKIGEILIEKTKNNSVWAYSKKRIAKAYLGPKIMNAVKAIMKLVDWE